MAGFYTSQSLSVDVGDDPMKEDLLLLLADQRALLEIAVAGVDEEQARTRTTVSELTLGGIVKHLAHGELDTADMIAHPDPDAQFDLSRLDDEYTLGESETWAQALDEYAAATTRRGGDRCGPARCDDPAADRPVGTRAGVVVGAPATGQSHPGDGTPLRPRRHHPGGTRRSDHDGCAVIGAVVLSRGLSAVAATDRNDQRAARDGIADHA